MSYVVKEKQQLGMHFMDDAAFECALMDKKESVKNG